MNFAETTISFNDKEVKVWHLVIGFLVMGIVAAACAYGLTLCLTYITGLGLSKAWAFFIACMVRAIFLAVTHSTNSVVASHVWGNNAGTLDTIFSFS